MVDDFGKIFYRNDKVYRAIYKSSERFCLELLNSDLFRELTKKKLIPQTKLTDLKIDGFNLILEHEKILETLEHEWSFNMFLDAAKLVLEVNSICNKYGYELKDAHSFNVLFRNTQPVFIDIGSISKVRNKNGEWTALNEFVNAFYIPLLFWREEKYYIVRKLLESNFYKMQTFPQQSLFESGLLKLLKEKPNEYVLKFRDVFILRTKRRNILLYIISRLMNKIFSLVLKRKIVILAYEIKPVGIKRIQNILKNFKKPTKFSEWANYHNKFYSSDAQYPSSRFKRIIEIIQLYNLNIRTVIDLAGNEGILSILIQKHTKVESILLADNDENAIDQAYTKLKGDPLNRITPILLNFIFTPDIKGTLQRFRTDLAIALAVTHHLTLRFNISLGTIMDRLNSLTRKFVMVEFMPLGLYSIEHETSPEIPEWYTIEWFRSEFEKYFRIIIEEQLEKNRIILFGEKLISDE